MTDFNMESPYFLGAILVLAGFIAGFVLSGLLSSSKKGKPAAPATNGSYLKGVNYILSNEPDRAIEEFSKAVKLNSDTIETYIALGNLFRNKGEVGRAIRIHQSIIVRPHIDKKTKIQARYDLSLDYKKAGFVKRAINSFEELLEMEPDRLDAHIDLLELYEDMRDWEKAYQTQLTVSKLRRTDDNHVLAHHQVELGKALVEAGQISQAKKAFKKATSLNTQCIDAYLHLGDLFYAETNYSKAVSIWRKIVEISPQLTYLAYNRLVEVYFKMNQYGKIVDILKQNSKKNYNDVHTHLALAEYLYKKREIDEAIKELEIVLKLKPSHIKARQEMGKYLMEQGKATQAIAVYQELLNDFPFTEKNFQCSECGYESVELLWKCPQCRLWDSINEKPLAGEIAKKAS